jgi:hypothetical protein
MGLLLFLFGGGNAGLIAKSIAMHHRRLGNFNDVLAFYYLDFDSRPVGSRNYARARFAAETIKLGTIINYRDIAALALFVDAAPDNYSFQDLHQDFSKKIAKYLIEHGLDMTNIAGNVLKQPLLMDLIEARERLAVNSSASSLPPSSYPPWSGPRSEAQAEAEETVAEEIKGQRS